MTEFPAFGPFQVDPTRGTLLRDGRSVVVGQRGIALLLALVAAQGKTVAKSALMAAGWPGLAVEEGNLTVQIAGLRKLLGTGPQGQDWIVTVPRVGYRLIQSQTPEPETASRPTLAVLPFQNLSGEAEADYFADGIVADIITALSRFHQLAVVSRNSSFVYKGRSVDTREVAQALGVRYLLEGSVRRSGDRLRITAQLVEGVTGVTLWTNRFDGDLAEIFDFQDRITESVATLVAPAIEATELAQSKQKRPTSISVYDHFLRAREYLNDESALANAKAHALLMTALAVEPNNPQLLAHAAWALEHRTTMGWQPLGPSDVTNCVDFARHGIRQAAGDPRVLAHCGVALILTGKDYDAGMAVMRAAAAAAAANPNDLFVLASTGIMEVQCGTLGQAQEYFHRAIRLGPNDPHCRFAFIGLAFAQIILGRYEAALENSAKALALNDQFDATYWMLIAANGHLGRITEAQAWISTLHSIAPDVTLARILAAQPVRYPERFGALAHGMRLAGMTE